MSEEMTDEEIAKLVEEFGENWETNRHYLERVRTNNQPEQVDEDGNHEIVDKTKPRKPKGVEGIDYRIRE